MSASVRVVRPDKTRIGIGGKRGAMRTGHEQSPSTNKREEREEEEERRRREGVMSGVRATVWCVTGERDQGQ